MKIVFRILYAFILLIFLAACAAPSEPDPGLPSPTPVSTLPPDAKNDPTPTTSAVSAPTGNGTPLAPTHTPDAQLETPTITLSDNGSTLKLKQGQRFLLNLGEAYEWQLVVADQSIVSRVKNVMVVRGAQGLFDALNPGQSEVSAMGDPVCRSEKPACTQPTLLFRLTVIVE